MKKSGLSLRLTAVLLSLILTVASIPVAVIAEDEILTPANETAASEPTSDALIEDMSKRDSFTKHYVADDGSRYAVIFSEQVHYEDNGEWVEVDNRMTLDTATQRYETANSVFSANFAASASDDSLVSITDGEHTLSWSVVFSTDLGNSISATATAQLINSGETASVTTVDNMENMGKATSALRYNGVGGGNVDLRYTVLHGKVEEDIILNSLGGFTSYTLEVNTGGLAAAVDENGTVTFSDTDGSVIFTVAAPWMMDANYEVSDDITVSLFQRGDTAYVNYAPSSDWLSDPERAYPVLIDPSFTTRYYTSNYIDTYVSEESTEPSLSKSTAIRLKLGKSRGYYNCPYIKILNIPDVVGTKGTILNATFTVWTGGYTGNSTVNLYEVLEPWNVSEITYANQPESMLITSDEMYLIDEEWHTLSKYEFDITSWLQGIQTGYSGLSSYFKSTYWNGFKLHFPTTLQGNVQNVYSSEYTVTEHRPTLAINYTYNHDEIFRDQAVYSFKSNTSASNYISVSSNENDGKNVHMGTYSNNNSAQSYSFRLEAVPNIDAFLIKASFGEIGQEEIVKFDYNSSYDEETGEYVYTNAYLGALSSDDLISQAWRFECVDGNNTYKIVSAADPNIVLTRQSNFPGSPTISSITAMGNVYVASYTNTNNTYQHWYIESGGLELSQNSLIIDGVDQHTVGIQDTDCSLAYLVYNVGDVVSWESLDINILSIDQNNRATPHAFGTARVRLVIENSGSITLDAEYNVTVIIDEGYYIPQNIGTEKYVEVEGVSNATGTPLQQCNFHNPWSSSFYIEWVTGQYYRLRLFRTGLYVGVDPGNTSVIAQYPTEDDYTLWKIQLTSNGNYKLVCKATENSNNVLSVPSSENTIGTDLTQSLYTDNENYLDEWDLHLIKHNVNLCVLYDNAYNALYDNVVNKLNNQMLILQEKYVTEFGILVNPSYPILFTSYADMCPTAVNPTDPCQCSTDDECQNTLFESNLEEYHHKNYYNIALRIDRPSIDEALTIAFIGHSLCQKRGDNHIIDPALGFAFTSLGIALVMNREGNEKETKTMIHEFNHFYGAPDHYGGQGETTKSINELFPDMNFNSDCVHGENRNSSTVLDGYIICNGCKSKIKSNADLYDHN